MKKVFLLLAAASLSVGANAQLAKRSIVNVGNPAVSNIKLSNVPVSRAKRQDSNNPLAKTTLGGSRWYNIVETISAGQILGGLDPSQAANTTLFSEPMYNNSVNVAYQYNPMATVPYDTLFITSVGCQFDPAGARFNDPFNTANVDENGHGLVSVKRTNAYNIDSAVVYGVYHRNAAYPLQVDTLRVVFEKISSTNLATISGPSILSEYGTATLSLPDFGYDSSKNTAAGGVYKKDILLTETPASLSLTSDSIVAFPMAVTGLNLTANQFGGASVTFIAGDSTLNNKSQSDTVYKINAAGTGYDEVRHNFFGAMFATENSSTHGTYISTAPYDFNWGGIQLNPTIQNGWDGSYYPTLLYQNALQYTYMDFHVTCALCYSVGVNEVAKTISTVEAYPNPAASEVYIPFTLSTKASVNVTVVNTLGQTIGTQNFSNVTNGKASFSTSALAAGVYFYTVEANGEKTTGRFVVAH